MQNRVEVEIFDNKCVVVGEEEEEYIQMIAKFVDNKIREIVDQTKTISTVRAVILASLNIADELFKAKKEFLDQNKDLKKENEELIFEIDNVIGFRE